ncbi:hypothetical protein BJ684DRAFT_16969 [Piptocephalis cylindrospora]|uniref:DC-UbP/UBTD2 N-terminal domain-containing protein n=1 Tax=Piptocephalis cylindrospora TaxID=1907219 RepID=A0A4P9Y1B7_9FUNG|nr:hypothetical protein BJ684DRAFT_16969 [Piptocephalis cylindrospora]|eukprot:RKP12553.1 hypothetical protein BJ684DRAFT_16969 [Piptocephalis cylindrospora]
MGCRVSLLEDDGTGVALVDERSRTGALSKRKSPLNLDKIIWKADIPMNRSQLELQRKAFWETAPAYDGDAECWAALRAVVSACTTDPNAVQTLLDSSGLTIPTGKLTEGAYDERGRKYVVPPYCLWDPENLLEESGDKAGQEEEEEGEGEEIKVLVRLSTNRDLRFLCYTTDRLSSLNRRICEKEGVPTDAQDLVTIRYLKLGRILDQTLRLRTLIKSGEPNMVLQAMVTLPEGKGPNLEVDGEDDSKEGV